MITASDLRKGTKFIYKDEPHMVIGFQHVKPGKGGAFVKTKMKNMISGAIYEETFRTEEKFHQPDMQYQDVQFLYSDPEGYHFMDQESYEQIALTEDQLKDVKDFLKEEIIYKILAFEGKPIAVTPPLFMDLEVTETVPGIRGDTAQGRATKPATLETGLVLQVPLFVNEGDRVKVDTRDSKYLERTKD
ncbi:MAG TPA: elongation factor P [Candidatus Babeliales bacterium]|nr:elongation factor P [Candidatus Babeliales bacterium]